MVLGFKTPRPQLQVRLTPLRRNHGADLALAPMEGVDLPR
jgi:hypothetical protein